MVEFTNCINLSVNIWQISFENIVDIVVIVMNNCLLMFAIFMSLQVNVSELGLVTQGGKVVWGKWLCNYVFMSVVWHSGITSVFGQQPFL